MTTLPRLVEKKDNVNVSSGIIFIAPNSPYKVTLFGQGYNRKERMWISHVLGDRLISQGMKMFEFYLNPMTTNLSMSVSESTEYDLEAYNRYKEKMISLGGIPSGPI